MERTGSYHLVLLHKLQTRKTVVDVREQPQLERPQLWVSSAPKQRDRTIETTVAEEAAGCACMRRDRCNAHDVCTGQARQE
jgi:hypothetical protein